MFRAEQDDNFNSGLQLDRSRLFSAAKALLVPDGQGLALRGRPLESDRYGLAFSATC